MQTISVQSVHKKGITRYTLVLQTDAIQVTIISTIFMSVCWRLYCYKSELLQVRNNANSNIFSRYSLANDFIIQTSDFIARSDTAHVTCSTGYGFSRDL